MIEWAKAGREILARKQGISPSEKAAMVDQIKAVDAAGKAFQRAETLRFDLPGRDPRAVNEAFTARYPDYTISSFSYDLKATLAIDAPEEARRLGHNYIGRIHLLLGLLNEGSPAKPILRDLGIDLAKARKVVEFAIGKGDKTVADDIRLTPEAERVIEIAEFEAKRLNHPIVTGEHLLLGLVWHDVKLNSHIGSGNVFIVNLQ